jgi:DNA uptake protein ComE-like DNA-binding protein
MHRPIRRALLGTATLIVALAGCDAPAEEAVEGEGAEVVTAAPEAAPAAPAVVATPAAGALLDPNAATREELLTVPNLDEPLADALIAGRPYEDMLAVDRVLATRLSEEQREAAYGRLWRPIDLNAATGEEILLIPGVGERMEHEFEEYRPYRAMEQFRREIGKYVDEEEVARLERYVEIR